MKLPEKECPAYFNAYLDLVSEDVLSEMEKQLLSFPAFVSDIPKEKGTYRYAPGKWSIKEVIGHINDTERIMANRALRIARNDQTPIPSFDEDAYVLATDFNALSITMLTDDFKAQRRCHLSLLRSLRKEELIRTGIASGKQVSARALFYFMVGHLRHHEQIITERYLGY
ncbi:MAG TPA: DinB family protein [Edaphocola sp.]|nr:DinB family protein [Edaphocola sp.]